TTAAAGDLSMRGTPAGGKPGGPHPCATKTVPPPLRGVPLCTDQSPGPVREEPEQGSIIVVIATDAPLTPDQLKRVVKRVGLGMGRMGSTHGNGSGDIFIAFSTANRDADGGNSASST